MYTFVKQVQPVFFYFTTFLGVGGAGYVWWQHRICGGGGAGYVVEELELRLALQLWLRGWQCSELCKVM